jgi:hypothetical protein
MAADGEEQIDMDVGGGDVDGVGGKEGEGSGCKIVHKRNHLSDSSDEDTEDREKEKKKVKSATEQGGAVVPGGGAELGGVSVQGIGAELVGGSELGGGSELSGGAVQRAGAMQGGGSRHGGGDVQLGVRGAGSSVASSLTLYVAGRGEVNLVSIANSKALAMKKDLIAQIGPNNSIKLIGKSLRITCSDLGQKTKLQAVKSLLNQDVEVTEPYAVTKPSQAPATPASKRGIIFGLSTDICIEDIKEELEADYVHRLQKREDGVMKDTTTIVFSRASGIMPEYVCVAFRNRPVRAYVPQPMRCYHCQAFGHKQMKCKSKLKCPRCGGAHIYSACTENETLTCPNCKGNHSAAYRGCPKYEQVQAALTTSVTQKMSYADAAKQVKNTAKASTPTPSTSSEQVTMETTIGQPSAPPTHPTALPTDPTLPHTHTTVLRTHPTAPHNHPAAPRTHPSQAQPTYKHMDTQTDTFQEQSAQTTPENKTGSIACRKALQHYKEIASTGPVTLEEMTNLVVQLICVFEQAAGLGQDLFPRVHASWFEERKKLSGENSANL